MELRDRFDADHPVVGMVHLPALPGSPGYAGDRTAIRTRAAEDATALVEGGVDGLILENFGDAPFYPDDVPKHVVSEMTAVATAVTDAVDVPVGINVLRNDAEAALAVAGAAGASFVRVNVHVGSAATDQGILDGRAHETMRLRERLDASIAVLADVHVKHAAPIGESAIERAALEATERGLASGVIVSGAGTGRETDYADVERVATALADHGVSKPVFVGSGVTAETIGDAFESGADGVIVGTAIKADDETTNPVSVDRVRAIVDAADGWRRD